MVYSAVITLGASAIRITDAVNGITTLPAGAFAWRLEIEPLRGNTHASYAGLSDCTNSGTGAAIQELAAPAAATPLDRFIVTASGAERYFDPGDYYVHGTSAEKVKATVWTA